jgi:uncharacterized protein (DUF1697 family)
VPIRVALLRGVNVGGHHPVPMADLRDLLARLGLGAPRTLLASGNALFDSDLPPSALEPLLERALAERFGFPIPTMVRDGAAIRAAAAAHPFGGLGLDPKLLHVLFLRAAPAADPGIPPETFAPDRIVVRGDLAYVAYPEGSARSRLTLDAASRALGVEATGRNWNTVAKLAALCG